MKGRKDIGGAARRLPEFPEADSSAPQERVPAHGVELCYFCHEQPSGASGHPGFSTQVYKIPPRDRSFVPVKCVFCNSQWVRRRINAKTFEWLRIVE